MIKVSVLYPYEEGKKFDHEYYGTKHLELVQRLLGPEGLVRGELDKGVSGTDPNSPPDFVAMGHLYFNTVEEVHQAFTTHAREIMGDAANYTDVRPQIVISETSA